MKHINEYVKRSRPELTWIIPQFRIEEIAPVRESDLAREVYTEACGGRIYGEKQ